MGSGGGAAELQQLATADDRDTLQDIARKLVSKKQPHEALRVARMIRDNFEDKKLQAFVEIAFSLDRSEALALLEEAWQLVKGDVASLGHAAVAGGFLNFGLTGSRRGGAGGDRELAGFHYDGALGRGPWRYDACPGGDKKDQSSKRRSQIHDHTPAAKGARYRCALYCRRFRPRAWGAAHFAG